MSRIRIADGMVDLKALSLEQLGHAAGIDYRVSMHKLLAEFRRRDKAVKLSHEAMRLALKRLIQLDAEDDVATLGPCPACQALRAAIAELEAT